MLILWIVIMFVSTILTLFIVVPIKSKLNLSGKRIAILTILSLFIGSFFYSSFSILLAPVILYATTMILLQDKIGITINKLFIIGGLVLGLLIYLFVGIFISFSGIFKTVIIAGIIGSLSTLTFYTLLPRTGQDKYKYFIEFLKYLFFIFICFQLFLVWSADRAYTQAKDINIKHVENKKVLDFYSPTVKEIRIGCCIRWSYRRIKYVNE